MGDPSVELLSVRVVTTVGEVLAAGDLFDDVPTSEGAGLFLNSPGHHLLVADVDNRPAGFVTGIEMRHPDKGLEVFVYELGVDDSFLQRGVASRLLNALSELAEGLGAGTCWTATEPDNVAAHATYRRAGGLGEMATVFSWSTPRSG